MSYWHHGRQLVRANVREIEFILSELQQHDLKSYNSIHVVRPELCFRGGTFVPRGHFVPSSCFLWAANSMVKFLLIDLHADTLPLRLSNSEYGNKPVPRTNTLVIDMMETGTEQDEDGVPGFEALGTGCPAVRLPGSRRLHSGGPRRSVRVSGPAASGQEEWCRELDSPVGVRV